MDHGHGQSVKYVIMIMPSSFVTRSMDFHDGIQVPSFVPARLIIAVMKIWICPILVDDGRRINSVTVEGL